MEKRLFGTDGLRGRVNVYPLTADMALRLGLAAGTLFRDGQPRRHKVIIGKEKAVELMMIAILCRGHVLIEDGYPHHGAVAFGHAGKAIFEVLKYLGIEKISFNQPKGCYYKSENPFA